MCFFGSREPGGLILGFRVQGFSGVGVRRRRGLGVPVDEPKP